jgi:hypothetical protein
VIGDWRIQLAIVFDRLFERGRRSGQRLVAVKGDSLMEELDGRLNLTAKDGA